MDEQFIKQRIAKLRTDKNISARELSLQLGQSTGYINTIENGKSLPSMSMFLYICEYFKGKKESQKLFPKPSPYASHSTKANRDICRNYLTFFGRDDIIKYL